MRLLPPSVKSILKYIIRWYSRTFSRFFAWLLHPIAGLMAVLIPGNDAYPVFSRYGYHLLRKHYYLPIPEAEDLAHIKDSELVGLNIDEEANFDFLTTIVLPYRDEFDALPDYRTSDPKQFFILNGGFMAIDGHVYYGLIRHYKPRRIVEVGCGNSSLLATIAIRKNRQEDTGQDTELFCIDPYPFPILRHLPEVTQVIAEKVQRVDLDFFQSLEAGDILFIDSTHTLRPGGDVWWLYCEVLPRLASGVLVHVHDIALPQPYPGVYLKHHYYWNEQYVLQVFLSFNTRFEVIWAGHHLMLKKPERVREVFLPKYDQLTEAYMPGSWWLRTR